MLHNLIFIGLCLLASASVLLWINSRKMNYFEELKVFIFILTAVSFFGLIALFAVHQSPESKTETDEIAFGKYIKDDRKAELYIDSESITIKYPKRKKKNIDGVYRLENGFWYKFQHDNQTIIQITGKVGEAPYEKDFYYKVSNDTLTLTDTENTDSSIYFIKSLE